MPASCIIASSLFQPKNDYFLSVPSQINRLQLVPNDAAHGLRLSPNHLNFIMYHQFCFLINGEYNKIQNHFFHSHTKYFLREITR